MKYCHALRRSGYAGSEISRIIWVFLLSLALRAQSLILFWIDHSAHATVGIFPPNTELETISEATR